MVAAEAIAFYVEVLGATERMRIPMPDGKIGHAELTIGDGLIMLADAFPGNDFHSPKAIGGTPVVISIYVEDVDAVYDRALAAGAKGLRPPSDQFYGDRAAKFVDPFGHQWGIASHIEEISHEEMMERSKQMPKG